MYMTPSQKGKMCEIGRVMRLYDGVEGEDSGVKMLTARWYFNAQDLPSSKRKQLQPREVLASLEMGEEPVSAIEGCRCLPCHPQLGADPRCLSQGMLGVRRD